MSAFSRLAEEAMAGAGDEADVEKRIEEALACPCIGDLKEGPCGPTFVHAFRCFIKSDLEGEEKGMDCLPEFKVFQECLQKHPEHIAKLMEDPDAQEAAAAAEGEGGGKGAAAAAEQQQQQQQPAVQQQEGGKS